MAGKPREIWDEGILLDDAWLTFARAKTKADYAATFDSPEENYSTAEGRRDALIRVSSRLLGHSPEVTRRAQLREAMQSDLLDWLLYEAHYAYGFPVRPSRDRTPRRIPSEFWENPDINWEKGIASDVDSEFQRIRIVDPHDFTEIELKPKIGRKTYKSLIYQAIDGIMPNCPEFEKLQNSQQIEKVREFIKREYPHLDPYEGKGFGNDAIRKHVKDYLKERNNK